MHLACSVSTPAESTAPHYHNSSPTIRYYSSRLAMFLPGDALATTIPFKVTTDTPHMILEVQSETSKATSDSELCPLRKLFQEMEDEGIVDTSIMGHSCARAGTQDQTAGEDDFFIVKPNNVVPLFSYTWVSTGHKFSTCASAFPREVLDASPVLVRYWRMAYMKADQELMPRKPLYFLRRSMSLNATSFVRLL
ncbi:unnamed protein product [Durusdinium trenchii]|uniref:Uncharacterized protein n=1 Tax=Durusdinium trenchii TaxID=1381693 RepID=A0ABP0MHR6_9DINO